MSSASQPKEQTPRGEPATGSDAVARELVVSWLEREPMNQTVSSLIALATAAQSSHATAGDDGNGCGVSHCCQRASVNGLCRAHHQRKRNGKRSWNQPVRTCTWAPLLGTPMEDVAIAMYDDPTARRHLSCTGYNGCLSHTVRMGWEGFSCRGCKGPAEAPP